MCRQAKQGSGLLPPEHNLPTVALHVESALARANLLATMERKGIVPTVPHPNPFNPITQTIEHDRWWREHPDAGLAFCQAIEERQRALCGLYVGSQLSTMLADIRE